MEAVNCKIKLANNKFILVNVLAYTISYELKTSHYRCRKMNNRNLLFIIEITFDSPQ